MRPSLMPPSLMLMPLVAAPANPTSITFVLAFAFVIALLSPWAATPAHAQISLFSEAFSEPEWNALPEDAQTILAPLEDDWTNMDALRRKKWLGIAKRYPNMSSEEQARLQRRMQEWSALAPEDRRKAREKYKLLRRTAPEQQSYLRQKWQEYDELPLDEKQRYADQARKRRAQAKARSNNKAKPQQSSLPPMPPQPLLRAPLNPIPPKASDIVPPAYGNAAPETAQ